MRAQNRFGWNLLRKIARLRAGENVLLSPLSLALSLAMVYNGAAGDTRDAIATTLALEDSDLETVNRSAKVLRTALEKIGGRIELAIANGLWTDVRLALARDFVQRVVSSYEAEVENLELNDASTAEVINGWVSRKTRGQIDRIIDDDDLRPPVYCVLTNAIYFKGLWSLPFDKAATSSKVFHVADNVTVDVRMMSRSGRYDHLAEDRLQAVRLPYADGSLAMYVYLPAADLPLWTFLEGFTAGALQESISRFEKTSLELSLPRCSLVYEGEFKKPLAELGMGIAFQPAADLTAMGAGERFLSAVKHKARAEVTEEGTEATAATAVILARSYRPPILMTVNRPFLFVIRDEVSGAFLFLGVVFMPSSP